MENIIKQLPNSFDATSWGKEIHRILHLDDKYDLIRLLIIKSDLGIFKVITYDLKWKDLHISKNEVTLSVRNTVDNQNIYFVDEFDYVDNVVIIAELASDCLAKATTNTNLYLTSLSLVNNLSPKELMTRSCLRYQ